MDRITLRCRNRVLERTFLDDFFEHVRTNLASRLEANGELGRILISAATAEHLAGAYSSDRAHGRREDKGADPGAVPARSHVSRSRRASDPES